jgi:glucosamine--fructose-6-phosphate aminotransferase (isomerizing)
MDQPLMRPKAKANEPSTDAPDDPSRLRRVQLTYEEAMAQAVVVRQAVAAEAENLQRIAARLADRRLRRILILGCGDSWFVGIGIRLALEHLLDVPVEPMQALDYALYYGQISAAEDLVIGISSGGNTSAVMDALQVARAAGATTIGVSNKPESPILVQFDHQILVRATRNGWPTQASTATMASLLTFGLALARSRQTRTTPELEAFAGALDQLPGLMEKTLQEAEEPMQALAQELAACRFLFFSAGGPHLAAAAFGAAKVKELCPIHAHVIPLEEFHHYRSLKPGDPLILIAPDAASHQRALDTAEVGRFDGGRIYALVPQDEREIAEVAHWHLNLPPVDRCLAPILYSLPLHLLAYYLAMEKFKRHLGHTPAFPSQD